MNKQKQTQELAKIDGWEKRPSEEWDYIWIKQNGYPDMSFTLPDYDSHDELQPIIDRLNVAQKREAILKAYGKWEESE